MSAGYRLLVFYKGDPLARERHTPASGAEALELIPKLVERHPECEKVAVYNGATFLFAVDCEGNRVPN